MRLKENNILSQVSGFMREMKLSKSLSRLIFFKEERQFESGPRYSLKASGYTPEAFLFC